MIDYEDIFSKDIRKQYNAPVAHHQDEQVRPTQETRAPALSMIKRPSKRQLRATRSKTPSEVLQLPTPETTPNSSMELFQRRGADGNLASSYTGSFQTAREDNSTPTPGTIRRKPMRTEAASSTPIETSTQVPEAGDLLQRLTTPDLPIAKLTKVNTGSPKHVKARSQGQKSLRADLEGVQDETQVGSDHFSSALPSLTLRNTNVESGGTIPQASITFPQTPPPRHPDLSKFIVPESSSSNAVEVVEALVLDLTPPQRKRKLRHTPKDTDLRDAASQSGNSNRTSYSDASLLAVGSPWAERNLTQLQTVPSHESTPIDKITHRGLRHTGKMEVRVAE
jgi:hypothetical protein